MKSCMYILLIALLPYQSFAQAKKGYEPSNSGTRNYASGINSFKYGIKLFKSSSLTTSYSSAKPNPPCVGTLHMHDDGKER